jgi:hypothetical protein
VSTSVVPAARRSATGGPGMTSLLRLALALRREPPPLPPDDLACVPGVDPTRNCAQVANRASHLGLPARRLSCGPPIRDGPDRSSRLSGRPSDVDAFGMPLDGCLS